MSVTPLLYLKDNDDEDEIDGDVYLGSERPIDIPYPDDDTEDADEEDIETAIANEQNEEENLGNVNKIYILSQCYIWIANKKETAKANEQNEEGHLDNCNKVFICSWCYIYREFKCELHSDN